MGLIETIIHVLKCQSCGFVKNQYYPPSSQSRGEFGSFNLLKCDPGDIIEIHRGYLLNHWALYCGNDYAIHLQCESVANNYLVYCTPVVKVEEKLEDIVKDSLCRVNNLEEEAKERGLGALPTHQVLDNGHDRLDEKCDYSFWLKNGEHYVTQWKYVRPFSTGVSEVAQLEPYLYGFDLVLNRNILQLSYYGKRVPNGLALGASVYHWTNWSTLSSIFKQVDKIFADDKPDDKKGDNK